MPGTSRDWARTYFIALEAMVIATTLLSHFGGYHIRDIYGLWPAIVGLALFGLLLISSLIAFARGRRGLAAIGLIVTTLVVAHALLFPTIVR